VQGETKNISYFLKSTIRYSNPSQNRVWDFTEREEDRTIGLFMNNTWQTVELVNSTLPLERMETDDDGNPVAVLQFPESVLNPGESLGFTVWYHIVSKPRLMPNIIESESLSLTDIPTSLVNEYTREEGPWQTNNQTLRELASNLKGSETRVLTIIKNFITWIGWYISYPKERHENPYYPNVTYARREGDCDDQAVLLITLSRIVGIPSYLQVGSIYSPGQLDNASYWNGHMSIVERQIGWHGWAVVYVPPWGWLPVDLTYVRDNPTDPLSSITSGAVTNQDTIQYMNVTRTDYVNLSLEAEAFLTENGFQVYTEDEMILDIWQDANGTPPFIGIDPLIPASLAVAIVLPVVILFLISRRWRKRIAEETPASVSKNL